MERGKPYEMVLAIIGTVAWAMVAVFSLNEGAMFGVAIGVGLVALSIVEIIRWQQGAPAMGISNRARARRGDVAVPTTAWFGLGGLSAEFAFGVIWGVTHRPSVPMLPSWVSIGLYLVFGAATSFALSKSHDRRVRALNRRPPRPELPPAPRPSTDDIDAHGRMPLHELEGPTSTLNHLKLVHGTELDVFSSRAVIEQTHVALHAPAPDG